MERFQDRRIIVTGGGSGIGQATVLRLLAESGTVYALDIDPAGLDRTSAAAKQHGTDARLATAVVDIADEAAVGPAVATAVEAMGGLDILVNNAGIMRGAHTHECAVDLWSQVIAVNLTGTFLVTRAGLPALLRTGRGVVVNVSSVAADFGHPYLAAYAASKGGIDAFTRAIAVEYAGQGRRAVAVKPGGIATGITAAVMSTLPPDTDWTLFAKMQPRVSAGEGEAPAAQLAAPDVVAGVIATLASDDGRFVTSTSIRI